MELKLRGNYEPSELDSDSLQEQEALLTLSHLQTHLLNFDSGPPKDRISLGYLLSGIIGYWVIGGIQGRSSVSIQDAGPLEEEEVIQRTKTESHWGKGEELQ